MPRSYYSVSLPTSAYAPGLKGVTLECAGIGGTLVLKLRQNIALEGDTALARRELMGLGMGSLTNCNHLVSALDHLSPEVSQVARGLLAASCRAEGIQGYATFANLAQVARVLTRASFIQQLVWISDLLPENIQPVLLGEVRHAMDAMGGALSMTLANAQIVLVGVPIYTVIELSAFAVRRAKCPQEVPALLASLLESTVGWNSAPKPMDIATAALSTGQTTSHLFHGLHYYKAKFFPRMVRAMVTDALPRLGRGSHRMLDPFVGSGTALLEGSLLGVHSVGCDVDPLAVKITAAKLLAFSTSLTEVVGAVDWACARVAWAETQGSHLPRLKPEDFPSWLLKNRKFPRHAADDLSAEIAQARAILLDCPPPLLTIFEILVSDAVSRRIKMRLLGTGIGRFSLSFSAQSIPRLLVRSLRRLANEVAAWYWLRAQFGLDLAPAEVLRGDARSLPESLGPFDLIVTSPPYLPASSGRESYAKARALSFLALEMLESDDVEALVGDAVGSMNGVNDDLEGLLDRESEVVSWLRSDALRSSKAAPTARYFKDLRVALGQMHSALRSRGVAMVVIGTRSTFYRYASRAPLFTVEAASLLARSAESVGFVVEDTIDIQLHKLNRNARPRSLDAYFETILVLRRS